MKEIILATGNEGKQREFIEMLGNLPFKFLTLNDFPHLSEVAETGQTFIANAELKVRGYAKETGGICLADDSGLEVAALGNAPGVYSARYAGKNASNAERIAKLLDELKTFDDPHRRARFVCVIAVANPAGEILFCAEGICQGKIAFEPRGDSGFGYDPIFIPDGLTATFGEISTAVKHEISHRAKAIKQVKGFLYDFQQFDLTNPYYHR